MEVIEPTVNNTLLIFYVPKFSMLTPLIKICQESNLHNGMQKITTKLVGSSKYNQSNHLQGNIAISTDLDGLMTSCLLFSLNNNLLKDSKPGEFRSEMTSKLSIDFITSRVNTFNTSLMLSVKVLVLRRQVGMHSLS